MHKNSVYENLIVTIMSLCPLISILLIYQNEKLIEEQPSDLLSIKLEVERLQHNMWAAYRDRQEAPHCLDFAEILMTYFMGTTGKYHHYYVYVCAKQKYEVSSWPCLSSRRQQKLFRGICHLKLFPFEIFCAHTNKLKSGQGELFIQWSF